MSTLKELRGRIKTIRSTQKITAAMQMVAAAKLRRSQDKVVSFRSYHDKMTFILNPLLTQEISLDDWTPHDKKLLKGGDGPVLLLVMGTHRGLCGGYNANLIKAMIHEVDQQTSPRLGIIGRKSLELLPNRLRASILPLPLFDNLDSLALDALVDKLKEWLDEGKIGTIKVIHYTFKNIITQTLQVTNLVPVVSLENPPKVPYLLLEPQVDHLLPTFLQDYLKVQLYRIFLESNLCEQAARMTAMDSATRNARDILQKLQLTYNQTRQDHITNQLIEIISAAQEM